MTTTRIEIGKEVKGLMQNRDDLTDISSGGMQGYDLLNNSIIRAYRDICTGGFYHGSTDHRPGFFRTINLPELETKEIATQSSSGSCSVTNGSATVTGLGYTSGGAIIPNIWLTELTRGDRIVIASSNYVVGYVSTDSSLALMPPTTYGGTTSAGASYTVYPARYNYNGSLYYIMSVYDVTDDQILSGDSFENYQSRQRTQGIPSVFVRWQNSILLDPSPTVATVLEVTSRRLPADLDSDTTALVTPNFYDEGIIFTAAKKVATRLGDYEAADKMQQYLDEFLDRNFPRDDANAMNTSGSTVTPML